MKIETERLRLPAQVLWGTEVVRTAVALCLCFALLVLVLGISVTLTRSGVTAPAHHVTRTNKGDRLPMAPTVPVGAAATFSLALPEFCESAVSSLVNSQMPRIAARCLS